MSTRQFTVGSADVADGKWTRAHKILVGFVAFITLGLLIAHVDVQRWDATHTVHAEQYEVYLFPCQVSLVSSFSEPDAQRPIKQRRMCAGLIAKAAPVLLELAAHDSSYQG